MSIPRHQRQNFERTSELLNQLRGLLLAIDAIAYERNVFDGDREAADSVMVLLNIAREKYAEIDRAHTMEWVGLGGKSSDLTDEDRRIATGESGTKPVKGLT